MVETRWPRRRAYGDIWPCVAVKTNLSPILPDLIFSHFSATPGFFSPLQQGSKLAGPKFGSVGKSIVGIWRRENG
jgi:hypothetical protein